VTYIRESPGSHLGRDTILTDVLCGFFSLSKKILDNTLNQTTAASFKILSKSLFSYHHTFRRYVSITEELLGRNSNGSGQENLVYDRGDPLR
jgi:hypothetical protein